MAKIDDLERRIQTLEAHMAELVDRPSSKEVGTKRNPIKTVFLASRDNSGESRAVEVDPSTGNLTTRRVDT